MKQGRDKFRKATVPHLKYVWWPWSKFWREWVVIYYPEPLRKAKLSFNKFGQYNEEEYNWHMYYALPKCFRLATSHEVQHRDIDYNLNTLEEDLDIGKL